MGCTSSTISKPKGEGSVVSTSSLSGSHKLQRLSEAAIKARIDCSEQNVEHPSLNVRYAWLSQRGFYPDALDKENQDSYIITDIGGEGENRCVLFGVFDGHGKDGHLCSTFVRDNLPDSIKKRIDKIPPQSSTSKSIKQALTLAHLEVNEMMHNADKIDDSLSGTTSITCLFRNDRFFVSNVGDSRAILVYLQADGRVVAKPLSSDQTPYRKDERERVKQYGARILSIDQIEGIEPVHENWGDLELGENIDEGGDPPRIWAAEGNFPGTAFSRSLGDRVAEFLGVTAEPEILEREIHVTDKYMVIASDGVFEFMTNQMVADIVMRHNDPVSACKAIVATAYDLWLQYEVRTDDITIIIISFDDNIMSTTPESSVKDNKEDTDDIDLVSSLSHKPVRRAVSREKKKNMILQANAEVDLDDEEGDIAASQTVQKSDEEVRSISGAIKNNFLFHCLTSGQKATVISVMQPVEVKAGQWVITQGDPGNHFYVVDSGRYEVRVRGPAPDPTGGNVVHVYESGPDQHPGFGELSLMYNKPRAASVIALEDGKLWALDRKVFKRVVMRSMDARRDIIRTLRRVQLLSCLNINKMQQIAELLEESHYVQGDYIIKQGEVGDAFYIIVSGSCICTEETQTDNSEGGRESRPEYAHLIPENHRFLSVMKEFEFFGEKALLNNEPRTCNVIATCDVRAFYLRKEWFEELLGPLSMVIEEASRKREFAAQQLAKSTTTTTTAADTTDGDSCESKLVMAGLVSSDAIGPLLLGYFGGITESGGGSGSIANKQRNATKPNVCIRSFLISEINKLNLSGSVIISIEAAQIVSKANHSCIFVPKLTSVVRDPNAVHLVFANPVVSDLSYMVRAMGGGGAGDVVSPNTPATSIKCSTDILVYIAASLISAIEFLHSVGIVYRAIQPESLCVDWQGRVILMDYKVCKIGGVGSRSFTICGASDYLAPEQISQRGHGAPVDLWALGVLLFELATDTLPFSANSEVATYAKISSFGSKAFPALPFPDDTPHDVKNLINCLLMPTPEARLGANHGGLDALKRHSIFHGIDWHVLDKRPSPLSALCALEYEEIVREGVDTSILESFAKENTPDQQDWLLDINYNFAS